MVVNKSCICLHIEEIMNNTCKISLYVNRCPEDQTVSSIVSPKGQ